MVHCPFKLSNKNSWKFLMSLLHFAMFRGGSLAAGGGSTDMWADTRTEYLSGDLVFDSLSGDNGNAGTPASPKEYIQAADITYALANNRRIWLRGGSGRSYDGGTDSYNLFMRKDASSANRMTVATYPGDTRAIWTASANTTAFNSNYWDFRNIDLRAFGYGKDCFFIGENVSATNIRFIDCIGRNDPSFDGDNNAIIHCPNANADYLQFVRCVFDGTGISTGDGSAQILVFATRHLLVLGCRFNGSTQGFYFKHDHTATDSSQVDILFRNNIYNTPNQDVMRNCSFARCENELYLDCWVTSDGIGGSSWGESSGRAGGRNSSMNHCSFIGSSLYLTAEGGSLGPYDFTVTNSLICDRGSRTNRRLISARYETTDLRTVSDYNLYQNNFTISTATVSLASRQSGGQDLHSLSGTPTFVGSNTAIPADWALASGSAGKNAASDGADIGCDVTKLLTVNS